MHPLHTHCLTSVHQNLSPFSLYPAALLLALLGVLSLPSPRQEILQQRPVPHLAAAMFPVLEKEIRGQPAGTPGASSGHPLPKDLQNHNY